VERRSRKRLWLIGVVLFLVALLVSIWIMGPAPPRKIVMATGEEGMAYDRLGKEYQQRLGKMGLSVELINSAGSLDNLRLLLEGKADLALVQAGTYASVEEEDADERLRGLVAVGLEPVWVFYQGDRVNTLADFKGKSVAIGQEKSGTENLALHLLRANGIRPEDGTSLLHRTMTQTRRGLVDGSIDAGFMVSSTENPLVQELLQYPDVHLMSFRRHLAYSQRFRFLKPVVLGEGVLDLRKNLPPEDVNMFAVPTLLVCREDLHPGAVEQVLMAAKRIHGRAGLITSNISFPTLEAMDVPVHQTAEAYVQSGESLTTRILPYWGVWLVFKLKLLLLPLLVVWLPFFRILPMLYRFRINRLLRRHYLVLRDVEDKIVKSTDPEEIRGHVKTLDDLRHMLENVSRKVPTHLQINVYQWRLHVAHVRAEAVERLWRLEKEHAMMVPLEGSEAGG
jgi:TRAP transporter TAXI family solute receptor